MSFLRQSTQVVKMIGPYLDATDGVTEETGLAGGGTELSKEPGAAFGTGPTLGTHDAEGWYPVTLTTTHTNTVGLLIIKGQASATHLPVWHEFTVVEEAVYDLLYADSATGIPTDMATATAVAALNDFDPANDDVAVVTLVGTVTSLASTALDLVLVSSTFVAALIAGVWDRVLTGGTHNITNSAGRKLRLLADSGGYELGLVWFDNVRGTAGDTDHENGTNVLPLTTEANANTILASLALHGVHMAAGSSITFATGHDNEEWTGEGWTVALGGQSIAGAVIRGAIISGVSVGVPTLLDGCFINASSFAGGDFVRCALGNTFTLTGTPASGYHLFDCHHAEMGAISTIDFGAALGASEVHVHDWHGNLQILNMDTGDVLHFSCSDGALTLDASNTAGTVNYAGAFGLTDNSSGMTLNNLGNTFERVGAPVAASISADIAAVKVDTAATLVDTGTTLPATLGTPAVDVSADIAAIKVDTAATLVDTNELQGDWTDGGRLDLLLDTLITEMATATGEPAQGAPGVSLTRGQKTDFLYKAWRNHSDQTATLYQLYNDDTTTVDHKRTVSDDATTFDSTEVVTGP